jgi:hypothetical protein
MALARGDGLGQPETGSRNVRHAVQATGNEGQRDLLETARRAAIDFPSDPVSRLACIAAVHAPTASVRRLPICDGGPRKGQQEAPWGVITSTASHGWLQVACNSSTAVASARARINSPAAAGN